MTRVLFVCTGNICRSPTAEAVARTMAAGRGGTANLEFDSAGIEGYHVGEPPDRRAITQGRMRGYDLSGLRARRVTPQDFEAFDLILAMDGGHFEALQHLCPPQHQHKVQMFDHDDVPDPYSGDERDFAVVLDICETVVARWLAEIGATSADDPA